MTKPVLPNAEAEEEIRSSVRYYEDERPGLGDRLLAEIDAAIALIAAHPAIGESVRRVRGKVRRFPLNHFPFLLVYREHPEYLEIVALAHTSRKPGYWRTR